MLDIKKLLDFNTPYFDAFTSVETSPTTVRDDLRRANEDRMRKWERYVFVETKATTAGAIRYDKDRVQSSNNYDLTDVVIKMSEAQEAWHNAELYHSDLLQAFTEYLIKAGFDDETIKIWLYRYGNCYSLNRIAKLLNVSRGKVQYHLGDKFEKQYLERVA